MWKVTRKGLAAHKLRFLLTGIAVLLGVAFISGTFVFTATIQQTFDDLIGNIYKNTDAQVRGPEAFKNDQGFGGNTRPRIPATLAPIVRRASGVETVEGNVQLDYAQLEKPNGKVVGNPAQGAPSLGFGWNPDPRLSPWRLVPGGRGPTENNEIVIDRGSAKKGKFVVGQRVTVLTNKPPAQYTITGIARFGDADNLAGASVVLFTVTRAQVIADAKGQFDYINVKASPGVSQEQVAANIRKVLPAGSAEVVTGKKLIDENKSQIDKALSFLNIGLLVFGIIALIVGAFIIFNTFSIVVAQRSRELALLRAIGASRRQVVTSVFGESLVVGIVASALGVAAGVLLAIGLRVLMKALGVDLPGSGAVVPPQAIIFGMAVGIIVTIIASLGPALTASRVPPIAAMRDVALERPLARGRRLAIGLVLLALGVLSLFSGLNGGGFPRVVTGMIIVFVAVFVLAPLYARSAGRLLGLPISKIFGITGTLARENVGRNPRRTSTTAAALMIGVALVAFISIFAASAKASFTASIDSQIKADYIVNSGGTFGGTGLSPQLGRQVAALPEIAVASPLRVGTAQISGDVTLLAAIDPGSASLFDFDLVAGNIRALSPNGLVISQKKADSEHWKLGTTVPVTFVKTGRQPMKIEGIYGVKNLAFGGPIDYIMSIAGYEKHFAQQLDVVVYAKLKPGVSAEQGSAAITPLLEKYPTAKLQDLASYKQSQVANLNGLLNLVYGLLFFAIIIAFIGVVNTLVLSIYERTREVGLLRAVGMSRWQVRVAIGWESLLIAFLGTLMGIVIGFFFGWAVVQALKDQGITHFSPAIGTMIVVVVVAFFLGIIAALLPARRAAKLDVLQAISSGV